MYHRYQLYSYSNTHSYVIPTKYESIPKACFLMTRCKSIEVRYNAVMMPKLLNSSLMTSGLGDVDRCGAHSGKVISFVGLGV